MSTWWQSLTLAGQFFWGVALFGSILQALVFAGSMLSGSESFGHDSDAGDGGDVAHGVRALSVRSLVAFAVGFGWAGVLGLAQGWSVERASIFAVITGLLFMALIYATMRFMVSLRADGTLQLRNALGQVGRVYVTIPPARQSPGQIEVLVQGRLITARAVSDAAEPLPPQTSVRVCGLDDSGTLVVERETGPFRPES